MDTNHITQLQTGVLVIGGGGAALRAALAAADTGADVLLVTKGAAAKSGATYCSVAEVGAFNVPDGSIDPTDSPEVFYWDIMDAALGMADEKLARIVAEEAADTKRYLEDCGMRFARRGDGGYLGYRACFSSKARSHVVENHFKPIVAALGEKVRAHPCIKRMEHAAVTNLIVGSGACCGAFALHKGELYAIRAAAVVLAAGGGSTLFARNMYPPDVTGDGYAMAYRAGAVLANMEFIQAGIGLAWPEVNLFGNQLWEAMPRLTNGSGQPFLAKYIVGGYSEEEIIRAKGGHFPFSTRDISRFVEIGVQREIAEGSPTARGNVYLDFLGTDFDALFTNPGSRLRDMWPMTVQRFRELGCDLHKERIEVSCFAHAINGGVLIDENGESSVPGLYAAGEVASGPHGADRLGGNMSLTCQVFGRRAGEAAAKRAEQPPLPTDLTAAVAREREYLNSFGAVSVHSAKEMLRELQTCADRSLLIVRDAGRIERFLQCTAGLEQRLHSGGDRDCAPVEALLSLRNLIETGRMIASCASSRTESRGSHYRSDFPAMDDRLAKPQTIVKQQ